MIQLRTFQDSDYPAVAAFWTARGAAAPGLQCLPRVGVVATSEETVVACGFAYADATRSGMGYIAWVANMPHCCVGDRRGIHHIVTQLETFLASEGIHTILATTNNEPLLRFWRKRGYLVGDTQMTHLSKRI